MNLLEKFDAVVVQADNRISETISVYAKHTRKPIIRPKGVTPT